MPRGKLSLKTSAGAEPLDCSTPGALTRLYDYLTLEVPEEDQRAVLHELARSSGVDPGAPGRNTLMTWDEIRKIAAHPLVGIGAHTVNHFNLKRLSEESARREMTDVRRILEAELGETPRHLAYPYGYASAVGCREVLMAKEAGYVSAVTTRHGVLRAAHANHLHALPRISINGRYQRVAHVRTMLSGITTPLANRGKMLVDGLSGVDSALRPWRQDQPFDDAHGGQDPQNPGQEEKRQVNQRSRLRQLGDRHHGRDQRIGDHQDDQQNGADEFFQADGHVGPLWPSHNASPEKV